MTILREKNIKAVMWQILAMVGMNLVYVFVISQRFDYMGFEFVLNPWRLVLGTISLLVLLAMSMIITNSFYFAVWHIMFIIFMVGEVIFYQFNPGASIAMPIILFVFFTMFALISQLDIKIPSFHNRFIFPPISTKMIAVFAVILFLPYVYFYHDYINLKNLLLIDVYETRELFREVSVGFLNYVTAPLSRILLPVLIIKSLEKKKFGWTAIFSAMILYVYLAGALKSVFFGLIALIIFYLGTYEQKSITFIQIITGFVYIGLVVFLLTDSVYLLDIFIRRVFFIPPSMNNHYVDFFTDNYTYFAHSPFGVGIAETTYNGSLSMFVGENVIGDPGLNANVGLFTEGYFSLGYIGGFLMSLIVSLMMAFFNAIDIDPKYFGIIFVYIYYINTAFLSVLLVTHGLLFLIVFAFFFLRKPGENTRYLWEYTYIGELQLQ